MAYSGKVLFVDRLADDGHCVFGWCKDGSSLEYLMQVEPQLIFDMLHGIYVLLCQYCCGGLPLSEESLRSNYSSIYVMLDLAADFGYPFIMEGNVIQMLLNPSSMIAKAIQLVQIILEVSGPDFVSVLLGSKREFRSKHAPPNAFA